MSDLEEGTGSRREREHTFRPEPGRVRGEDSLSFPEKYIYDVHSLVLKSFSSFH